LYVDFTVSLFWHTPSAFSLTKPMRTLYGRFMDKAPVWLASSCQVYHISRICWEGGRGGTGKTLWLRDEIRTCSPVPVPRYFLKQAWASCEQFTQAIPCVPLSW